MEFKIPLFKLNFDRQEEKAVMDTLRSKWISTGPKTFELENKFASLLDAKYAVSLSNCTVSLHLAMLVSGIGAGDEVICPSLTFVATVNAIRYVGARPVFCDIISNEEPTIDPLEIERLITKRTKAIVLMHYAGFPCHMDEIMNIAGKYNLKVIEDACHGPLSVYKGKKLGTIGDIGCFSFFSNKNISTGEGGMFVTDNKQYAEKARLLRSHGMTSISYDRAKGHVSDYDVIELGYNYRIDDIRAAIGLVQLNKLENDLKKRAVLRAHYIEGLQKIENIIIPFKDYKSFSSNYIFPVVLKNSTVSIRDRLRESLKDEGIQTSVHYPSVHRFSIYKDVTRQLARTEYVSDNEITLPFYSSLRLSEIEYIIRKVKKYMGLHGNAYF